MTLTTFFGCLFIAYGPITALFFGAAGKDAELILLTIAAGFFWLLGAFVASVIWIAIPPAKDEIYWTLTIGVLMQEISRLILYFTLKKAKQGLIAFENEKNQFFAFQRYTLVSGIGFAATSAAMQYSLVVEQSAGPGVLESPGCPSIDFFTISAISTMFLSLLNVCWMLNFFIGLDNGQYWKPILVVLSHFFVSYLSTINNDGEECAAFLVPLAFVFLVNAAVAIKDGLSLLNRLKV
eukprot:Clim_evm17s47 gene=Clim_evmTU17s47